MSIEAVKERLRNNQYLEKTAEQMLREGLVISPYALADVETPQGNYAVNVLRTIFAHQTPAENPQWNHLTNRDLFDYFEAVRYYGCARLPFFNNIPESLREAVCVNPNNNVHSIPIEQRRKMIHRRDPVYLRLPEDIAPIGLLLGITTLPSSFKRESGMRLRIDVVRDEGQSRLIANNHLSLPQETNNDPLEIVDKLDLTTVTPIIMDKQLDATREVLAADAMREVKFFDGSIAANASLHRLAFLLAGGAQTIPSVWNKVGYGRLLEYLSHVVKQRNRKPNDGKGTTNIPEQLTKSISEIKGVCVYLTLPAVYGTNPNCRLKLVVKKNDLGNGPGCGEVNIQGYICKVA